MTSNAEAKGNFHNKKISNTTNGQKHIMLRGWQLSYRSFHKKFESFSLETVRPKRLGMIVHLGNN